MKQELPKPIVIGGIVAVVALVLGLGWYFISSSGDHVAEYAGQGNERAAAQSRGSRAAMGTAPRSGGQNRPTASPGAVD